MLNEDEFCAGLPHNSRQKKNLNNKFVTAPGKDACQGDSGGPLVCSFDNRAVLIGIVSHGSGCGEAGKPGIYAKIDFFMKWLKSGNFKMLYYQKLFNELFIFLILTSSSFRTNIFDRHKSSSNVFSNRSESFW